LSAATAIKLPNVAAVNAPNVATAINVPNAMLRARLRRWRPRGLLMRGSSRLLISG
jgi:hypothetical protein